MTNRKLMLQIDFRSGLPIYAQIVNQVQAQVVGSVLKPGDQLPTVRALAEELRVNFNTVARAYRLLDEARLISTQRGRGTYIWEEPTPQVVEELRQKSLQEIARNYLKEVNRLGFTSVQARIALDDALRASEAEFSDDEVTTSEM